MDRNRWEILLVVLIPLLIFAAVDFMIVGGHQKGPADPSVLKINGPALDGSQQSPVAVNQLLGKSGVVVSGPASIQGVSADKQLVLIEVTVKQQYLGQPLKTVQIMVYNSGAPSNLVQLHDGDQVLVFATSGGQLTSGWNGLFVERDQQLLQVGSGKEWPRSSVEQALPGQVSN